MGNVGFVFTKEDLVSIRDMLLANKVKAPAKAGALAPLDVMVPAQNTGLGPEKTSFFQALNIPTKITKGTIEITNNVNLITAGDKVGMSEATLLNMLGISPFTYGLAAVTDITFKEAETMKAFLADPTTFAVAAPVAVEE